MEKLFSKYQFFCFVFVIVLAVFLNFPSPKLSARLQRWRTKGNYFNYQGLAVFYKDEVGIGDKDSVVLCIHGFPTSSFDWSKIWDSLKKQFGRVIAVDMLGFGFSDKPFDRVYTVHEQATIHEMILTKLKIKNVHILAHDLGDTVAQEMLARFEERDSIFQKDGINIKTLCLSNGGIFPETNFPRIIQKLMLTPWLGPAIAKLISYPVFTISFSSIFGPNSQPTTEDLQDFYALARHKDGYLIAPKQLEYIKQRQENRERWVGSLQQSTVPVHLIYGPSDPVNPPVMLHRFRNIIPKGSDTELDQGIGHYPHWEDPQGFFKGYLKFLHQAQNS